MAKKTSSYFSVIDFFGFRLAIPFENPLSLCAAVIHAMLYPKRSQSDELGTLSLQVALHTPGALLNVVHSLPEDLDEAIAKRISNHPWQPSPLTLTRPPFARESVPVRSHDEKSLMTLFPLEDIAVPEGHSQEYEPNPLEYITEMGLETPYLNQLRRVFSADNQKDLQIAFLRWLKDVLVLYEQKMATKLTYIFYPYHPYLLKQVKRFGPLGSFFAQQGAYDTDQFNRTRQALVQLLILQNGHSDYIEDVVRPLLLHEYAVQLASLDWLDRKPLIVVVPYTRGSLEFALYRFSRSQASCYLGSFTAEDEGDAKAVGAQVAHSCFQLREKDELAVAIFQPGETPQQDAIQYFHCTATGIASIKTVFPLNASLSPPVPLVQLGLGLQDASQGLNTIIHAPSLQIAMQDIERIALLQGLDRFDRLNWIDRLLNFHLVLYVLHRGVRDCNCCRSPLERDTPSTCARFFAIVDCTREFRSDVALLCYSDFAFLRDGIRKNYSQFVRDRLAIVEEVKRPLPQKNAGQTVVERYWKEVLELPTRGKAFKKFWSILSDTYSAADLNETRTAQHVWTEALVHYFSSGGSDLARIFQVINTHGRMIGFVEPTTGSSRRRKLTMTPNLLETLIHCIADPGQELLPFSDVIRKLYERYGLVVNVGDAYWQRAFEHVEDRERTEGWISNIGEQNVDALRKMLREAGLLLEYSDSNAVVKVHYGISHPVKVESEVKG